MNRTLETRLAKLESRQVPAVAAHILFALTASVADAMIAERIAKGMVKEADHFIVIQWVRGWQARSMQKAPRAGMAVEQGVSLDPMKRGTGYFNAPPDGQPFARQPETPR